jgi:hypothetical protein
VAVGTDVIAEQFLFPSAPASSNPSVLAPGISPMSIVCRPGAACTEPPRTFLARTRGTAQITVTRSQCGATPRCVTPMGTPMGTAPFEVTIVVE